jgi:phosphatidylglycerophosphatase A
MWAAAKYMKIAQKHDASEIVIDETAGLAVSFLSLIYYTPSTNVDLMIYAFILFVLFRFFDALKPFPINWLDNNLKGAWGVMIDDIAAGFAAAITFILGRIIWAHLA